MLVVLLGSATPTRAQQRRDWPLAVQPDGNYLVLDNFLSGAQLSVEHRTSFYNDSNTLTLGATTLQSYPLGEATARADLRILFLQLGGSIAYRAVWRNLAFEPDPDGYCLDCTRKGRRKHDKLFGRSPGSDHWMWAEARAMLLFPFNENLVMASLFAARHEDRGPRTFDWFFANVHDGGLTSRWETQLYVKHRDWGGIGPYVQVMWLPRAGRHDTEIAVGFNALTRPGLLPRDDLLFLTFLIRPNDDSYGQHSYYLPVRALLVYRMVFPL